MNDTTQPIPVKLTRAQKFEQDLRDAGFRIIERTPEELERQVDEAIERVGNEMCGIWPMDDTTQPEPSEPSESDIEFFKVLLAACHAEHEANPSERTRENIAICEAILLDGGELPDLNEPFADDEESNRAEEEVDELTLTAIHEAGHAVCRVIEGLSLLKVTIRPTSTALGKCIIGPLPFQFTSPEKLRARIRSGLAGYIAESIFYPRQVDPEGAQDDFDTVDGLLQRLFPKGAGVNEFSAIYDETETLLRTEPNLSAIRLVAAELLKHTTISGKRVRALVSQVHADQATEAARPGA